MSCPDKTGMRRWPCPEGQFTSSYGIGHLDETRAELRGLPSPICRKDLIVVSQTPRNIGTTQYWEPRARGEKTGRVPLPPRDLEIRLPIPVPTKLLQRGSHI